MTVLIAGGGIGGLTLALSLHQIGIPCRVFESVAELKPLGVGINVLPHAVRELIELGLLDKLDAAGVRTKELSFFSKHGKPIWTEPRGLEAGYKWPQFSIHRGVLQQILLDTVVERLGAENVLTSHHLSNFTDTPQGVHANFLDKATGQNAGTYEGSLLIAADGIHSAVREKLYPQEGPPIWNGRILWRGITESDAFSVRAHHDHGGPRGFEIRLLSDFQRTIAEWKIPDQLDRRTPAAADLSVAARGLQSYCEAR